MRDVVDTVQNTTRYLVPETAQMSGSALKVFGVMNWAHHLYRYYSKKELYSNPDNFGQLLAGHVLNFVVGDNMVIRTAAHCILIVNRIMACVDQQVALYNSYQKWTDAVAGRFSRHCKQGWSKGHKASLLSPSTDTWLQVKQLQIWTRIQRIVQRTWVLLQDVFKLSMNLMDAIEAFSFSPAIRNESMNELFINLNQSVDRLANNQQLLLDKLIKHKHTVARILDGVGSSYKVDKFIDVVQSTVNATKSVQSVVNAGNGFLTKVGQHAATGLMVSVNLGKHIPTAMIPGAKKADPAVSCSKTLTFPKSSRILQRQLSAPQLVKV